MNAFRPLPAPWSWELYTCHPTIHRLFLVRIFSSHPHDSTSDIFTILKISDLCWSSPLVLRLHNRTPSFFSQEFFAFWSQAHHLLTSFPYSTLRLHSPDQHSTFKKETSPSGCQVPSAKCQVPNANVQCSGTWMPLRAATPQADISTVSGRTTGNLFKWDQVSWWCARIWSILLAIDFNQIEC